MTAADGIAQYTSWHARCLCALVKQLHLLRLAPGTYGRVCMSAHPCPPPPRQVSALRERPACAAALCALGFRPLLLPPRPGAPERPPQSGAEPGQSAALSEVGLVADHTPAAQSGNLGGAAARRAAAEVLSLLGVTCE